MSLISLVAREDFISVVTDIEYTQMVEESVKFKEIIPDTALIAFSGDDEFAKMTAVAADTLVKQGFCLKEIAELIQTSFSSGIFTYQQSGRAFEAVLAGYSQSGEAQYHIISNSKSLESYYPHQGESLYYANGLDRMIVLERSLKMHGMGTLSQAQTAQLQMLHEAAKSIPNISSHASTHVLKRAN
jgi:hypothetical protein